MIDYQELGDHQLIFRVAMTEKEALEALYSRYSSSVYSLAMFMLKNEALAEEVTQDIFLNIWTKASSYNAERGEPKSWIMSVAHHRIVDVIRSRRRTQNVTDPGAYDKLEMLPSSRISIEEEVERRIEREYILEALDTLPQEQREVIMLAYFQGYSQSEMAKILDQPLGTVKTRVRLAMKKLRAALEGEIDDGPI